MSGCLQGGPTVCTAQSRFVHVRRNAQAQLRSDNVGSEQLITLLGFIKPQDRTKQPAHT